jgi:hypothetical protein
MRPFLLCVTNIRKETVQLVAKLMQIRITEAILSSGFDNTPTSHRGNTCQRSLAEQIRLNLLSTLN